VIKSSSQAVVDDDDDVCNDLMCT